MGEATVRYDRQAMTPCDRNRPHKTTTTDGSAAQELVRALEADLIDRYGVVLSGEQIQKVLNYPSMAAYQQALTRGQVPVPVFPIKNRRGRFALAKDVARYLVAARAAATGDVPET